MTSPETPASPASQHLATAWQRTMVPILGVVVLIAFVATATIALKKPKQDLRITNTGSQSVDILNVSGPWWDKKTLTLHPGMTGFWSFRDGDQFHLTRSTEETPKPDTTPPASPLPSRAKSWGSALIPNPDGSGTIAIKHASRTAEVRINESGKIEFEFTDL